jgi:hypothetical protein
MGDFESGREYFGHGLPRRKGEEGERDADNRHYIGDVLRGRFPDKPGWPIYDSNLTHSGEKPTTQFSYERTFLPLIEQGDFQGPSLREYIEKALKSRRGEAIGIDFGGPGSRVFRGSEDGFFKRTLGVTLRDERSEMEGWEDRKSRHDIIDGNMFDPVIRREIRKWLKGEKADLIFERMKGGLTFVNHDIRFIREVLKQIYSILRKDGVAFLQHFLYEYRASGFVEIFYHWAEEVKKQYGGKIIIVLDPRSAEEGRYREGAIMIRKLKNAPERLPLTELLRKTAEKPPKEKRPAAKG